MKKNFKNLMALVLTGAMLTAGSSVFADYTGGTGADSTGALTGTGGKVDTGSAKKIQVIIPTSTRQMNFVLDPAGAMSMVEDTDFEIEKGASVYFESEYDDPYNITEVTKYGSMSAPLYFRNKGIMPVNIAVCVDTVETSTNIVTKEAKDFKGEDAGFALSAGMINKDGKILTDLVPVKASGTPAIVTSVIDDSRNLWEVEASGFTLTYTTDAEETDFAQTGVVYKAEADVAYDWDTNLNSAAGDDGHIDPSAFQIKTIYTLSVPEAKVVRLSELTDKSKDLITLTGVKKATKDGGTDTLTVRFIETADKKGTSEDTPLSELTGLVSVKADNQIEITEAGWKGLYSMAGGSGVATIMISAPGAQGVTVTIRD